ncbi:RNA binding protein, putative isoform 2 [Hibiscus syriacus]|uniref:RNA binding protein, putative isoform 2 n=1 Tax=Hibiscus syriacus TaxID=106335 RepID=A0A6A3BH73_HIBSY|nr:RNA binding protein, putative isoform 2 [Hibiscus syriacus]
MSVFDDLFVYFIENEQMALKEGNPAGTPSAQVVGNVFVEHYYQILHQSPNLVHRFYQDSSCLSRPDMYGNMTTVTTMQDYTAEIKTADAQDSFEKGVIVLVTGCLTGKDNVRRKFTQTFFLAPQDKGYFVLNDVFRYVEDKELQNSIPVNDINEQASTSALAPEPEAAHDHLVEDPITYAEDEDINSGAEVFNPSDKDEGSVIEEVVEPQNIVTHRESVVTIDSAPAVLEDARKKSYASIVKVIKSNTASTPVYVPTNNVRVTIAPKEPHSIISVKPAPVSEAALPDSDNAPETEGHSIYIRYLPYTATPAQLEVAFKKFGPIKRNGIQVRSNKQGFTFGFVEFKNASSVQIALEVNVDGAVAFDWKRSGIGGVLKDAENNKLAFFSRSDMTLHSDSCRDCCNQSWWINNPELCPVLYVDMITEIQLGSVELLVWEIGSSPITIGDRQADVEEKRTNTRVGISGSGTGTGRGRGRGRYASGKMGFQSDNFRGRGNFNGGRAGYGRNEFRNQGNFQDDQRVLVDGTEITISELIKTVVLGLSKHNYRMVNVPKI